MNNEGSQRMHRGELTDGDRLEFLYLLDKADFEVTDWEAQFIASMFAQKRDISDRQREVIDKLIMRYGARLAF